MKTPEQERLQKGDVQKIVQRLEAEGYETQQGLGKVWFKKPAEDTWWNGFFWIPNRGWSLRLLQPIVHAVADLDYAITEIEVTEKGCKDVEEKWEAFSKSASRKNWEAYQGAQVTHLHRLQKPGP